MLLNITKLKNYEEKLQDEEDNISKNEKLPEGYAGCLINSRIQETIKYQNTDYIDEIITEDIDSYKKVVINLKNKKSIIFSFLKDCTREKFLQTLFCMIENNQR